MTAMLRHTRIGLDSDDHDRGGLYFGYSGP